MENPDLAASVLSLQPFLPAKDFELSKRFYAELGFTVKALDADLAEIRVGAHAFLLQNYFVAEWAGNSVMHMTVGDLDGWWRHIAALDLAARYKVESPRAPKLEPWGLNTAYVFDPAGVLWHLAQAPA